MTTDTLVASSDLIRHERTFLTLEQLGREIPPYRHTIPFEGEFIDAAHAYFSDCPMTDDVLVQLRTRRIEGELIKGWLRREDALKLYELAYFADDKILELGCHQGLSTSVIAWANENAPEKKAIFSVDLEPRYIEIARKNLTEGALSRYVQSFAGDAVKICRDLAADGAQFAFVFVDHSHAYAPVRGVCEQLAALTLPGGFCLFHDYNDARNRDRSRDDYGVYQACEEVLPENFEFWGIFGCTGLYRRK